LYLAIRGHLVFHAAFDVAGWAASAMSAT